LLVALGDNNEVNDVNNCMPVRMKLQNTTNAKFIHDVITFELLLTGRKYLGG